MRQLDDLLGLADRLQRRWAPAAFAVAVVKKFGDDRAGDLAALIAYYAFVAIFPLLLVFVTLLDIVLRHDPALRQRVISSALSAYPQIGPQLQDSVHALHSTGLALVIGLSVRCLAHAAWPWRCRTRSTRSGACPATDGRRSPGRRFAPLGLVVVMGLARPSSRCCPAPPADSGT